MNLALLQGWLLGLTALLTVAYADEATADANRPNIIFILADDLGYGDLGCYGGRFVPTPNIDQMAREGVRFTQHYAGSTVCAPSRACLLTGQHTGHVFQRVNGSIEFRPDPQDICIARLLKDTGYATAMIGKSGLSCNSQNGELPNKKGFDFFFGFTSHVAAHRYYPEWLWRNGKKVPFHGNKEMVGQDYSGDLFIEESLQFIEENAEGPFFLHIALQQPHADLNVPRKWREPFLGKFEEVPFGGNHYRAEPDPKATFAGMLSHLDTSVGRVLNKLRMLGIDQNTLVLFASDNGAMSEGGWRKEYFKSSGPLRGGKRDLYEGGIRVPFICWWPGTVAAGQTNDHVAAFWDFLPTACELARVEVSVPTDGISYMPTLLGKGLQRNHDYLYWEFYEQGGKQAIRRDDWKAVGLNVLNGDEPDIELYNLRKDLGEANDVAIEHPEIVAQLRTRMAESHEGYGTYQMRP